MLLLGVGQYSATLGDIDLGAGEHGVPVAENGVTLQVGQSKATGTRRVAEERSESVGVLTLQRWPP